MTRDTEPGRPIEAGTPLALGLRLLDHQILGREQEMVGNVDDVALEERDGRLVAVGLLRGPGAWAHRQPGALGRWGRAVWRRLDHREDPRPLVLPLDHVLSIGSAVHALPDRLAFGVDINATHHRSVARGWVTGTATALRLGRHVVSYEVVIEDDDGQRVCTARVTCQVAAARSTPVDLLGTQAPGGSDASGSDHQSSPR